MSADDEMREYAQALFGHREGSTPTETAGGNEAADDEARTFVRALFTTDDD